MIPLHLVTGFLGAGKTTFLNRLLRAPALARTLVVVNEFGEAALDHLLYEPLDGETLLIASGCVCCTLRGDFVDGLLDILVKRGADYDRVVVETSGLADPGPMLHALFADPHLSTGVRLAAVTTLVDAVNGLATLEAHGEARRQVALADRLAITKTDLLGTAPPTPPPLPALRGEGWGEGPPRVDPVEPPLTLTRSPKGRGDGGDALLAALTELAPQAEIVDARDLDAAAFLTETFRPRETSPRAAHGGAEARAFRSVKPIAPAAFARFLTLLGEFTGPRLLRIKGLVATADAPERPWLIQGAQHVLAPPERLACWPQGAHETTLVVIGENVAAPTQRLWDALTGVASPDAPDWTALADNPLAPSPGRGLFG